MMPFSLHAFCTVSLRSKTFLYAKKPAEFSAGFFTRFFDQKLLLFFGVYDFPAVIIAAVFADFMRLFQLVAVRALHQRGSRRLEVRIPRIRPLFGLFSLGYRHFIYTSLAKFTICLNRLTNYIIFNYLCQLFFRAFPSIPKNRPVLYIPPKKRAYIARP